MTRRMRIVVLAILLTLCFTAAPPAQAEMQVREEVPLRQDSGLTKAEYLISKKKYAEALGECQNVLKRQGPNADAYTYLGIAYQRLGDDKQARQNFRSALALAPTHLGANAYMAHMYLLDGNMPKALEQMQAIRAICGATDCEELTELESAINAARMGEKMTDPTASPATPQAGTTRPPQQPPQRGETPRDVP